MQELVRTIINGLVTNPESISMPIKVKLAE